MFGPSASHADDAGVRMSEPASSRTALGVALMRAVHQVIDQPPAILNDPIALAFFEPALLDGIRANPERFEQRWARALRSQVVVRSRYAEDRLAEAVARGVSQVRHPGGGLRLVRVSSAAMGGGPPDLRSRSAGEPGRQDHRAAKGAHRTSVERDARRHQLRAGIAGRRIGAIRLRFPSANVLQCPRRVDVSHARGGGRPDRLRRRIPARQRDRLHVCGDATGRTERSAGRLPTWPPPRVSRGSTDSTRTKCCRNSTRPVSRSRILLDREEIVSRYFAGSNRLAAATARTPDWECGRVRRGICSRQADHGIASDNGGANLQRVMTSSSTHNSVVRSGRSTLLFLTLRSWHFRALVAVLS